MRFVILACCLAALATAAPTRILDTMRDANNALVTATCTITWPSFRGADGTSVSAGTRRYAVRAGVIDIALQATAGGTPTSAPWLAPAYTVRCGGSAAVEYWQVPAASAPVTLAAVRQGAPGQPSGGGSGGDVLGPNASVGGEAVVFGGSTGKSIARAAGSGVARLQNGVLGTVPGSAGDCVRVDATSGPCGTGTGNVSGPGSASIGRLASYANSAGTQIGDSGVSAADGTVTAPGGFASGNGVDPGYLDLLAGAPTNNPPSGQRRLFVGSDGLWRSKDSAGTVTPIGSAGAGLPSGSGVVRVQSGVGSLVPGSAGDCVRVDGTSGACGSAAAPTGTSWYVPFASYSPGGGAALVGVTAGGTSHYRTGVDASGAIANIVLPPGVLTGVVFLTSIPASWDGSSALTVRLVRFDSNAASRRLIARVQCSLAALPTDQATAITWGASVSADLAGSTTIGEATIATSLSLSGCAAGAPVLIGIFRDGAAVGGGENTVALGARLSIP